MRKTEIAWQRYSEARDDLMRRRVGDRKYEVSRRSTGEILAFVVQTGERSRDTYPWEIQLLNDWCEKWPSPVSTLVEGLDWIAGRLAEKA
ncbi:MAG: hypothetical protein ACM3UO_00310 [Bacillota bacterium]